MKRLVPLCVVALWLPACANFIKEADAVVLDVVEGTDKISLEEERVEGAVAKMRVQFLCKKQLFAITNIYETPYQPAAELYEVPVGLITLIPSLIWYGGAELLSAGAAPDDTAAGPLYWSAAGLNPFLNVENGMFKERYIIRLKPGSKRPQEGARPEPFDASVEPDEGLLTVTWIGGQPITVKVPQEVLMTLNLVDVARVMPAKDAQRLDITLKFRWDAPRDAHVEPPPPMQKTVSLYIDAPLAERLYQIRDASRALVESTTQAQRDEAFRTISQAGFSKEAAMLRDRLAPLPPAATP
ncbi:MAG: hypothetical protein U1E76_03610 [Planctomycetota bacterium]